MPAVYSDSALAIIAGADTTSTTLSVLFYFLLIHPEYFQRLRDEIDEFFPDKAEPSDSTIMTGMPFLNACMSVPLLFLCTLLLIMPM